MLLFTELSEFVVKHTQDSDWQYADKKLGLFNVYGGNGFAMLTARVYASIAYEGFCPGNFQPDV